MCALFKRKHVELYSAGSQNADPPDSQLRVETGPRLRRQNQVVWGACGAYLGCSQV